MCWQNMDCFKNSTLLQLKHHHVTIAHMTNLEILEYLQALADSYDILNGPRIEAIICGGAALSAQQLIERSTKDIDLVSPPELPKEFWEAAEATAHFFQLQI